MGCCLNYVRRIYTKPDRVEPEPDFVSSTIKTLEEIRKVIVKNLSSLPTNIEMYNSGVPELLSSKNLGKSRELYKLKHIDGLLVLFKHEQLYY